MNKHVEIIKWFRKMGYDGEFPESWASICNKSTYGIWEQLMINGRPKQEVNNLRNNVIINRLRCKPLNKQDEFSYPIKEIDVYNKKQTLGNKLRNAETIVREKRHELDNISQANKMKYITIEKLKMKIKEAEEREYLLNQKCKMLEQDIQAAEETLNFAESLTPVELDENPNTKEITETLQKCSEKLEAELRNLLPSNNIRRNCSQVPHITINSTQKPPKAKFTFEQRFAMSERKNTEQITILKQGVGGASKNYATGKENSSKVSKNLFNNGEDFNINFNRTEPNKRESLGLLPEACFRVTDDLQFLSQDDIFSPKLGVLKEFNFNSSINNIKEKPQVERNISKNLTVGSDKNDSHVFLRPNSNYVSTCTDLKMANTLEKLYSEEFLVGNLQGLLHGHNRQIIWDVFQNLNEKLTWEITKNIVTECGSDSSSRKLTGADKAQLLFQHVQIELKTMKNNAALKDLLAKICRKKENIYANISSKGYSGEKVREIMRLLDQQLDDVGLDAVIAVMKKEIHSSQYIENKCVLRIEGKTSRVKEDIAQKKCSIQELFEFIQKSLQSCVRTRETTVACVRRLNPFVSEMSWSEPLTHQLCSEEIKVFEKFPLEYNRRCIYTDPKIYYRDLCVDSIPGDADIDSDDMLLYMLTNILDSPSNPPETILLNVLKNKMKLEALKSQKNPSNNIAYTKYTLEELRSQESYIVSTIDKFNSITYSTSSNKILSLSSSIKKIMEVWLEMPIKDFVSPKRTLQGKDYKYYEKQFDGFYNNF